MPISWCRSYDGWRIFGVGVVTDIEFWCRRYDGGKCRRYDATPLCRRCDIAPWRLGSEEGMFVYAWEGKIPVMQVKSL